MSRLARKLEELLRHQYWGLGLIHRPASAFLEPSFQPEVRWIELDHFAADPMLVTFQGETAILYEAFDYGSHRGRIASLLLKDGEVVRHDPDVIQAPWHMSYPFCLEWNGDLYCIPEQSAGRRVIAYRCLEFPHRWEAAHELMNDIPLVDPTLWWKEDRWWLWGTYRGQAPNANLWLYTADHPFGPWYSASPQPIRADVTSSRPAGPLFEHAGRLYRPAQDCSRRYGGALVLNEVTQLGFLPDGTLRYEESLVRRITPIQPSPYPMGIHHLASNGDWSVIDGLHYRFYWAQLRFELLRMAGRRLEVGGWRLEA